MLATTIPIRPLESCAGGGLHESGLGRALCRNARPNAAIVARTQPPFRGSAPATRGLPRGGGPGPKGRWGRGAGLSGGEESPLPRVPASPATVPSTSRAEAGARLPRPGPGRVASSAAAAAASRGLRGRGGRPRHPPRRPQEVSSPARRSPASPRTPRPAAWPRPSWGAPRQGAARRRGSPRQHHRASREPGGQLERRRGARAPPNGPKRTREIQGTGCAILRRSPDAGERGRSPEGAGPPEARLRASGAAPTMSCPSLGGKKSTNCAWPRGADSPGTAYRPLRAIRPGPRTKPLTRRRGSRSGLDWRPRPQRGRDGLRGHRHLDRRPRRTQPAGLPASEGLSQRIPASRRDLDHMTRGSLPNLRFYIAALGEKYRDRQTDRMEVVNSSRDDLGLTSQLGFPLKGVRRAQRKNTAVLCHVLLQLMTDEETEANRVK
ncbi:uncharacterized protein [Notamacropus eugenii]|uniref:uncharacterized protein n=1 Tax=Notamacropus eugenii TaxID=9315 RepID=UPI003B67897D